MKPRPRPRITELTENQICNMSRRRFTETASQILTLIENDRQENQLLYYKPVSETAAQAHESCARRIFLAGGNGSSKTDTCLAELSMLSTGVFPDDLKDNDALRSKFRGPVACRVVVESLTTTLHPTILPKLQYWKWSGVDSPGGLKGHWGWIPREHLLGGDWTKAWSEKLRTLRVLCRDPDTGKYLGESSWQFLSVDNDPSDFASGDFHHILHDEPPTLAIWRENEARTMRVNGRMMLAMTWPDDPSIAVDWIYDELYDPGLKDNPDVETFTLYTTDNPNLDQEAVRAQEERWDDATKSVRIYGRPLRFSNLIHPNFTDVPRWWCFSCGKVTLGVEGQCGMCESRVCASFCHVTDMDPQVWPTVYLLDPHPRKPHMMIWVQVSPSDDLFEVAEAEVEGGPVDVREMCDRVERDLGLHITRRLIDPNMGASPASAHHRDVNWRDEFDMVGINCDLADDGEAGRARVNEYLKPDKDTMAPRISIRETCKNTIRQFKRYQWDDYSKRSDRDLKQKPKERHDDYPTLWKYLLNSEPTFRMLRQGAPIIRRMAGRPQPSRRVAAF